jgi:C1A family cysteine protease
MKSTNYIAIKLSAFFAVLLIITFSSCTKDTNTNYQSLPEPNYSYNLGCEMLPAAEYAMIAKAKVPEVKLRSAVYDLDVPPIADQGGEGSCVAFGVAYAARSIDWYKSHPGEWNKDINIFSPEFVYNQIKLKKKCNSGAYVVNALDFLKTKGVCTWNAMPYSDSDCSLMPNATQRSLAANYAIANYYTVPIDAEAIKTFLADNRPVIVAGPVNKDFTRQKNGDILDNFTGRSIGGHCYCIVGYDDNLQAFKFMNSWGTSWGTEGFGYISYDHIADWVQEAYIFLPPRP